MGRCASLCRHAWRWPREGAARGSLHPQPVLLVPVLDGQLWVLLVLLVLWAHLRDRFVDGSRRGSREQARRGRIRGRAAQPVLRLCRSLPATRAGGPLAQASPPAAAPRAPCPSAGCGSSGAAWAAAGIWELETGFDAGWLPTAQLAPARLGVDGGGKRVDRLQGRPAIEGEPGSVGCYGPARDVPTACSQAATTRQLQRAAWPLARAHSPGARTGPAPTGGSRSACRRSECWCWAAVRRRWARGCGVQHSRHQSQRAAPGAAQALPAPHISFSLPTASLRPPAARRRSGREASPGTAACALAPPPVCVRVWTARRGW